ncbi:MAG: hypothetical protein M3280_00045 [Actinomycetota bacterium]|nr:hypothetical protein [Actinomycetota bacterium]
MRKLFVGTVSVLVLAGTVPAQSVPPEGCEAVNPGVPKCSFKVTHDTAGPISGVAGEGKWVVIVKHGRTKTVLKSPSTDPVAMEHLFRKGDKVTAKALSPGSGLIIGGE